MRKHWRSLLCIVSLAAAAVLSCGCGEAAQQRRTETDCDYSLQQAHRQTISAMKRYEDAAQQPAYANVAAAVRSADAASRRASDIMTACEGTVPADEIAELLGITAAMRDDADSLHGACLATWPDRLCGR